MTPLEYVETVIVCRALDMARQTDPAYDNAWKHYLFVLDWYLRNPTHQ